MRYLQYVPEDESIVAISCSLSISVNKHMSVCHSYGACCASSFDQTGTRSNVSPDISARATDEAWAAAIRELLPFWQTGLVRKEARAKFSKRGKVHSPLDAATVGAGIP